MLTTLVNGAAANKDQLLAVADEAGVLSSLPAACSPLEDHTHELTVVLYECLLGSRRVRGLSAVVEHVKANKAELQKTLADRRRRGVTEGYKAKKETPRYVRVNTLSCTVEDGIKYIESSWGMRQVELPTGKGAPNTVALAANTFACDPHIPSLLILPPRTNLHGDAFVEAGKLVLQDRSSCLTALALSPPPGSVCLDTCAAPGNKTTHLAAILGEGGTVFAFERSQNRLATLRSRVKAIGADGIVTCVGRDVLQADLSPYEEATHALVDPSCSGSGLVALAESNASMTSEHDAAGDNPEVAALAADQIAILCRVMTLPKMRAVAYSTCSVHREENEDVVAAVLEYNPEWRVVPAVPSWPHRGLPIAEYASFSEMLVRATYDDDSTNGFFVMKFEKKSGKASEEDRDEEPKKAKKEKKEKKKKKEESEVESEEEEEEEEKEEVEKKEKKAKKEKKSIIQIRKERKKAEDDAEEEEPSEKKKKKAKADVALTVIGRRKALEAERAKLEALLAANQQKLDGATKDDESSDEDSIDEAAAEPPQKEQ